MELKLSEELRAKLKQYGQTEEKPDELLAQLEKSELLSPDFPRRSGMSHAEVGGGAAYRRVNTADAALGSIVAVGDIARHAIEALGKARHEPAVPLLIRLWSTCPVEGVWRAAGDALLAIGTPEALAALSANLDEYDPDGRITGFAVIAIFRADPAGAYDRLIGHFDPQRLAEPGGTQVPFRVIKALGPTGEDPNGALKWVDPNAPQWFHADPRWLDLCVSLRYGKPLRDISAHVLDYVDRAELAAAMARVKAAKGKRHRAPTRAAKGDLVARYRRGEHVEVWKELRRFKAIDGALREEALAVAVETMRRVARCCDLAAERLSAEGWAALFGHLRCAPEQHLPELIATLEQAAGSPVPPSLLAFWQVVGAVDFVWDYEQARTAPTFGLGLDLTELDPLIIAPAKRRQPHVAGPKIVRRSRRALAALARAGPSGQGQYQRWRPLRHRPAVPRRRSAVRRRAARSSFRRLSPACLALGRLSWVGGVRGVGRCPILRIAHDAGFRAVLKRAAGGRRQNTPRTESGRLELSASPNPRNRCPSMAHPADGGAMLWVKV